jgi:hypothetical protein
VRCFGITPFRNSTRRMGLPVLPPDFIDRADIGMAKCRAA